MSQPWSIGIRAFVVVIFDLPWGNKIPWLSSSSLLWSHSLLLSSPYVSNSLSSSTSFPAYLFLPLLILKRQRWHINRYPSSPPLIPLLQDYGWILPSQIICLPLNLLRVRNLPLPDFLPLTITSVIASPPIEQYPHGNITDGIDWVDTEPQQVLQ